MQTDLRLGERRASKNIGHMLFNKLGLVIPEKSVVITFYDLEIG